MKCGKRRHYMHSDALFSFATVFSHSLMIHAFNHNLCLSSPITRRQILDSSKLKEFADDNFKFDENGRTLSKWVENTVGKGEIARDEQFLLFPQCFQKACFPGASKGVIVWEWVKSLAFFFKVFGCESFNKVMNSIPDHKI